MLPYILRQLILWCDQLRLYTLTPKLKFSFVTLYVFNRSNGENLLKYQLHSSSVIMSLILMTTLFYKAVILQGEINAHHSQGLKD